MTTERDLIQQPHLMVPPNILLNNWKSDWLNERKNDDVLLTQAYQAGADAELEACCAWFQDFYKLESWMLRDLRRLRADRRPKPQTLTSVALQILDTIERDAHYLPEITDTIRRAILRLKQLEDSNG